MNRKDRRAQRKKLRLLKGGAEGPPLATKQPETTPAGRLFNRLDQFLRSQMVSNPDLTPDVVVGTLMQFTANVAASTAPEEVSAEEYAATSGSLFEQERGARANTPAS